jgi:TPR repeat protein
MTRYKIRFSFVAGIMVLALTACSTVEKIRPIDESLQLSDQQVTTLAKQAKYGDGNAAYRLYLYYSIIKLDEASAMNWAAISATNGNITAQYTMGMFYSGEINPKLIDNNNALFWFKKAASNGDTNALLRLQELKIK